MLLTVRQVGKSDESLDVRAATPDHSRPPAGDGGSARSASPSLRGTGTALLLVCLVGGLIAGFYLEIYRAGGVRSPAGYDTARYLDQTSMVAQSGLSGVARIALPPPGPPHTSRVAFPVLDLSLSRLMGTSTFFFAALLPTAGIVAMALAAGAFVAYALRRGAWTFATVALVVGTSTCAARLFLPETYSDNIMSGALFVAALVPLLSYLRGGKGWLPAALLMAMVALTHTGFFAFDLGILGLMWLVLLPQSLRATRAGTRFVRTPAGRLVLVVLASIAIPAVVVIAFLHGKVDVPSETLQVLREKLRADVLLYRWPIVVPIALVGVWGVLADDRGRPAIFPRGDGPDDRHAVPERGSVAGGPDGSSAAGPAGSGARFLLLLSGAWLVATVVGALIFWAGRAIPLHRLLAYFLPLPILAALGILAVAGLIQTRVARAAGAGVVVIGLLCMGFIGYQSLYRDLARGRGVAPMRIQEIQQAKTAERYLDAMGVARGAPIVFVTNDWGRNPSSSIQLEGFVARTVIAPQRQPTLVFYVGDPQTLLAGNPTIEPDDTRGFNAVSRAYWPSVARTLPAHPIEIMLSAFNRRSYPAFARAHADWVVAPGVLVLSGPRPPTPFAASAPPTIPRGSAQLLIFGAGTLVILGLVGLGWTLVLLPSDARPLEAMALSLGFGIGALIATGTILDVAGLRLGGTGGLVAIPLAAAAGWALAAGKLVRGRRGRDAPQGVLQL